MASPSSCGTHTELHSSETLRVTRCSCGTVHVTLLRSGVTVRMSADAFRTVAVGLRSAAERLEDGTSLGMTSIN